MLLSMLPVKGIIMTELRIIETTISIRRKTATQPIFDQNLLWARMKVRLIALAISGPSAISTGMKKRYRVMT